MKKGVSSSQKYRSSSDHSYPCPYSPPWLWTKRPLSIASQKNIPITELKTELSPDAPLSYSMYHKQLSTKLWKRYPLAVLNAIPAARVCPSSAMWPTIPPAWNASLP
jgi:hypothetical protein